MTYTNYFEVSNIIRELPETMQVHALFQDGEKILRTRCYFLGKINEIVFDPTERVLNVFIAPVELQEGEFQSPHNCSNFLDYEITYTNSVTKQAKKEESENGIR
jgi:hypothetical protein